MRFDGRMQFDRRQFVALLAATPAAGAKPSVDITLEATAEATVQAAAPTPTP